MVVEVIAALALAVGIALSPPMDPDPDYDYGQNSSYPTYIINGDGTRVACAPGGYSCWEDSSGLPSYLVP